MKIQMRLCKEIGHKVLKQIDRKSVHSLSRDVTEMVHQNVFSAKWAPLFSQFETEKDHKSKKVFPI